MDFFDEIETLPVKTKTFKKVVNIAIAEDQIQRYSSDEDSVVDGEGDLKNILVTKDDTMLNMPPSIGNLFGSGTSLLEKVKKRLNGEAQVEQEDDPIQHAGTQPMEQRMEQDGENQEVVSAMTQQDTQIVSTLPLSQADNTTQLISNDPQTQRVENSESDEDTQTISRHRKNAFFSDEQDQAEDNEDVASTQVEEPVVSGYINEPGSTSTPKNNLFVDESDNDDDDDDKYPEPLQPTTQPHPNPKLTEEEERVIRLQRIQALADKKRTERLLKQQQEQSKEDKDLSNDLQKQLQDGDAEYSSSEDESDLKRRNESLNIQENVVKKFNKKDLFAAFGLPQTGVIDGKDLLSSEKDNDTPSTTPLNSSPRKIEEIELGRESDSDLDVLNMLNEKSEREVEKKKKSLPQQIKCLEDAPKMIDLDDSDSDDDLVVHISKAQVLDIKAKFSKKNIENRRNKLKKSTLTKNQMFENLKMASKKQIQESRSLFPQGKEKFDEFQPKEYDVEDLLRKYIEHANVVKDHEEKSSLSRKLKPSLDHEESEDDADYEGEEEVPDSDIPDSDSDQDANDKSDEDAPPANLDDVQSSQSNEDATLLDDDESTSIKKKSRNRNAIQDDEDQEDFFAIALSTVLAKNNADSKIDLGSFGGNFAENQTQKLKDMFGVSMTQAFDDASQAAPNISNSTTTVDDIFNALRKNGHDTSFADDSMKDDSFNISFNTQRNDQPIFDESETQLSDIHPPTADPTQMPHHGHDHDDENIQDVEPTMKDTETQVDVQTQVDDDLASSPAKPHRPSRLIKKADLSDSETDGDQIDDDNEEDGETEEDRLRRAEFYKKQRRQEVQNQKKLKKQMKSRGLDKIMENEAEESEDEWFGVGGAEGERSDEENSEDEMMFDDVTTIKQNRMELVQKIAAEDAVSDQKMLMKILKDLETGNWKRRGGSAVDGFEFMDEEDEVMRRYRMYQQNKLKEKYAADEKLRQLTRDKKSKAFFESITGDSQDSKKDLFGRVESEESESEEDGANNPFFHREDKDKLKSPEEVNHKKKVRITQAFVQKSLSFLAEYDDTPKEPRSYIDDDESFEDLHTLKQNSMVQIPDKTPRRKKVVSIDLSSSPTDAFKVPSVVKRSFLKSEGSIKSNEVTISTSYKAASSSKASIMSFGKAKSVVAINAESHRVLKARKIEKTMKKSRGVLKSLGGSAFE